MRILVRFGIGLLVLQLSLAGGFELATFEFQRFNRSRDLIVLGEAALMNSTSVLRLTNHSHFVLGRALYSTPVQMKPKYMANPNNSSSNSTSVFSFSTTFVFSMVHPAADAGGHGIAFFMTPNPSLSGALSAEYLGLLNFSGNGQDYNHLFAVEFDTSRNVEFQDPDDNHVGVDVNNLVSNKTEKAGYWDGENFRELSLKSGRNIQAWIEYNHFKTQLNITLALAGMPKAQKPLISLGIDLSSVLQEEMYVGFSAATGNFVQDHYILAWSFTTNGTAPPLDLKSLPSFAPNHSKHPSRAFVATVTVAATLLLVLTIVARLISIKIHQEEDVEEWELEYWPHRFPYKDLSRATRGFSDDNLLGHGGYGRVYHGICPGTGLEVAVKCLDREMTEGMKSFIAEITSMGRLQHRNLVQLRGWCRRHKQLFIVYDYMPNGSLDRRIFDPQPSLGWGQRYHILRGVAAGILYLHEQWEKRVVHRDIKSSNVLLDTDLNARLGDFGLARLYDHSENSPTTHVVGTLGYIAPELIHTGKATPSSDVFSLGVLLLEVACGRKPVDHTKEAHQVVLVDWVQELHNMGSLLDAADPRLGGDYDVAEMERVLILGLLCSHPKAEARPGTRHAWQILEGEVPLPAAADLDLAFRSFPDSSGWSLFPSSSSNLDVDGSNSSGWNARKTPASDHSYGCDVSHQSISSGY